MGWHCLWQIVPLLEKTLNLKFNVSTPAKQEPDFIHADDNPLCLGEFKNESCSTSSDPWFSYALLFGAFNS
jgi:hypothetical protein